MKQELVSLRRLKDSNDDYKLLEKWYQQKEIYLYFEQRKLNFAEIKNKYFPRTLENTNIPVYMIEYNNKPVGIIQYKLIDEENKQLYKLNNDKCYEIDVFIGELDHHNKGIGRKGIEILSDYLFNNKNASLLVMCPLKENANAIKCYQKCGFIEKNKFIAKDTIGVSQEFIIMINSKVK